MKYRCPNNPKHKRLYVLMQEYNSYLLDEHGCASGEPIQRNVVGDSCAILTGCLDCDDERMRVGELIEMEE